VSNLHLDHNIILFLPDLPIDILVNLPDILVNFPLPDFPVGVPLDPNAVPECPLGVSVPLDPTALPEVQVGIETDVTVEVEPNVGQPTGKTNEISGPPPKQPEQQ